MGMRLLISNVITPEEAKEILGQYGSRWKRYEDSPTILKIRKTIESVTGEINWDLPTYFSVEMRIPDDTEKSSMVKPVIDWHVDTGDKGHMMWCDYGCTLLLNDEETSGYLEYKDGTKILPKEHFCSLAIHSNDEEHRIFNRGTREVLLCFVQRKL